MREILFRGKSVDNLEPYGYDPVQVMDEMTTRVASGHPPDALLKHLLDQLDEYERNE